jgi:hypothetical protein
MNIKPNPSQAAGNLRRLGSGGVDATTNVETNEEHRNMNNIYFNLSISERIPFLKI